MMKEGKIKEKEEWDIWWMMVSPKPESC